MNPPRASRVPLDEHPFPARDLLPRALYDAPRAQRASFPFARESPAVLLQASRGCRLRCAFCDIVAVQDRWNAHSPEYVVREIQHCVERYGAREIVFVDDNFMLDKRWAARTFELIVERRLDVSIDVMAGVAVWTLGESMIDLMARAGVYRLCLPIESGNPDTIRFIKKPVDLDRARKMIDYCNRRGLYTFANLIIGFPFETEDDVQRTIAWGRASGLDAVHYFIATPLPGARMYSIYEDQGWIDRRDPRSVTWRTQHFTRGELEGLAAVAARDHVRRRAAFYTAPRNTARYLVPKLASRRRLRYALRLGTRMLLGDARQPSRRARMNPVGHLPRRPLGAIGSAPRSEGKIDPRQVAAVAYRPRNPPGRQICGSVHQIVEAQQATPAEPQDRAGTLLRDRLPAEMRPARVETWSPRGVEGGRIRHPVGVDVPRRRARAAIRRRTVRRAPAVVGEREAPDLAVGAVASAGRHDQNLLAGDRNAGDARIRPRLTVARQHRGLRCPRTDTGEVVHRHAIPDEPPAFVRAAAHTFPPGEDRSLLGSDERSRGDRGRAATLVVRHLEDGRVGLDRHVDGVRGDTGNVAPERPPVPLPDEKDERPVGQVERALELRQGGPLRPRPARAPRSAPLSR